ncbi:uncharacterized protein LOC127289003 isoform X2 [Leptopilina boulardi]|uniref:uncharacterized protein LOC127285724 isoform X2 n=1 Tax=Leptopilina boulardi TaxID=63433 RepID=UPI0021F600F3|nr:uncharacterized protein LOC127285724 isoform X2 [Leptopilina boulardi]XP_051172696.1 uncharacterized protein LOC127289003 isoform X2 [Leptopilina boulardi]
MEEEEVSIREKDAAASSNDVRKGGRVRKPKPIFSPDDYVTSKEIKKSTVNALKKKAQVDQRLIKKCRLELDKTYDNENAKLMLADNVKPQNVSTDKTVENVTTPNNESQKILTKIAGVCIEKFSLQRAQHSLELDERLRNIILGYWKPSDYKLLANARPPEGVSKEEMIPITDRHAYEILNVAIALEKEDIPPLEKLASALTTEDLKKKIGGVIKKERFKKKPKQIENKLKGQSKKIMSDIEDLSEDEMGARVNDSNSENSEDEEDFFFDHDNADNDDNEEVFADDENLSDEEEEENDENAMEIDAEVAVIDNINAANPIAVNNDDNQEEEIPNLQETFFRGINTIGLRVPLEHNQNLRAIDYLLVALTRAVRHNSTYEHLIDDLKWIKKCFTVINMPTTKKALWKILGRSRENLIYRYFCEKCKQPIGVGQITVRCRCSRCGPGQEKTFVAIFIQILLRPQLTDLLRIPNIAEALNYRDNRIRIHPDAIEDIYDGEMYLRLSEPGNFLSNPHNYSLTFWTDGLKITRSSRATTYPIVFQVNELSPHARKKHLVLGGIWVANEHPIMNQIIGPIRDELRLIYRLGIRWSPDGIREVISRFIVTILTADSVARPDVLRMKRFNGENGCQLCLAPGQRENDTWVYPALPFVERTDASIRTDGLAALQQGHAVNGVKGVSALTTFPEFDMRDGVGVDVAHNAFLGAAKRLVVRYLTDAGERWYIGTPNEMAAINERLLRIKPPTRISRQPRSILLYKMWKASEWRNWLLYYALPCLDGILAQPYFNHLAMLCQAVYILNSASITDANLNHADRLINDFVNDYQRHYGLVNMVYNVHLLLHLVRSVRMLGPLWAYSALPFESLNKKITDYITSPNGRADQIVTRFFMKKFINIAAGQAPISQTAREEMCRLLKIRVEHIEGMPEGHYFLGLGRLRTRNPQVQEINLLRYAGYEIENETEITLFRRAEIHGTEYRVQDNVERKFCNHIVFTEEYRFYEIKSILSYRHQDVTVSGIIGQHLESNGNVYGTPHMQRVVRQDGREFIRFERVISPGFFIPLTNGLAAVSLCNVWETD